MKKIIKLITGLSILVSILNADINKISNYDPEEVEYRTLTYSLIRPTQQDFLDFVKANNISPELLQEAYRNPLKSPKHAFLYALAYDYTYPDIDVNKEYKLASDSMITIGNKSAVYEYADYIIRKSPETKLPGFFDWASCLNAKERGKCMYYNGISHYLKTKKCNSALITAKNNKIKIGLIKSICK